jgi:hypothetical protein
MLWANAKVRTQVWQSSVKLTQVGFARAKSASGEYGASTFAGSPASAVPAKTPTTAIVRSQRDICALPMMTGHFMGVDGRYSSYLWNIARDYRKRATPPALYRRANELSSLVLGSLTLATTCRLEPNISGDALPSSRTADV